MDGHAEPAPVVRKEISGDGVMEHPAASVAVLRGSYKAMTLLHSVRDAAGREFRNADQQTVALFFRFPAASAFMAL
jgi:hypothetical protein